MKDLLNFVTINWQILLILLLIFLYRYRTIGLLALSFEIISRWSNWNVDPLVYAGILIVAVCAEIYDGHTYYKQKYDDAVKTLQNKYQDESRRKVPYNIRVIAQSLYIHSAPDFKCNTQLTITNPGGVYTIVDEVTDNGVLWGKLDSGKGWILLRKGYVEKI